MSIESRIHITGHCKMHCGLRRGTMNMQQSLVLLKERIKIKNMNVLSMRRRIIPISTSVIRLVAVMHCNNRSPSRRR